MRGRFGDVVVVCVCGALALLFSYAFGSGLAALFARGGAEEAFIWKVGRAVMSFAALSTAFFVLSRLYLFARSTWNDE